MRLAIIGASGHLDMIFRGCIGHEDIYLVGISPGDAGEDMRPVVHRAHEMGWEPAVFGDYWEMLKISHPDIVVINNYFGHHYTPCVAAMTFGCHVFSEKPLASNLAEPEHLRAICQRSGICLGIMLSYRYDPIFVDAKYRIQHGEIGEVCLIEARKSYKFGNRPDFFASRELYGTTILWIGCHVVDWIAWLSGQPFLSVSAIRSPRGNHGYGTLDMVAALQFRLQNDVLVAVTLGYLNPAQAVSHADECIRISGTKGTVEIRNGTYTLINDGGPQMLSVIAQESEPFSAFLDQVKGIGSSRVSAEDAFMITEAVIRAQMASDLETIVYF